MFELNLASLPNHIMYLEGVQLSYIKVYVHIFNLWQAEKNCYLSTPEFVKRTKLDRATIIRAINFFVDKNVLKRVMKDGKRYLMQVPVPVQIEEESVDNFPEGSQLGDGGVAAESQRGSQLGDHNNKYNNKYNKSSSNAVDQKTICPNDVAAVASQSTKELVVQKGLFLTTIFANFKKYADDHRWKKDKNEWIFSFSKWVEQEKIKQDKNEQKINEVKSSVPRFDESHPAWDAIHTKRGHQELGLSHLRSIKERFVKMGFGA